MVLTCKVCGSAAPLRCSRCHQTAYCGIACQKQDLRDHKQLCWSLVAANPEVTSSPPVVTRAEDVVCAKCGAEPKALCSGCQLAYYCGKTCQQLHFPDHKKFCNMQEDVMGNSEVTTIPDPMISGREQVIVAYDRENLGSKVTDLISISRWWLLPCNRPLKPIQDGSMALVKQILKNQHPGQQLEMCSTKVKLTDCGGIYITYYWNDKVPKDDDFIPENHHSSQLSGTQFDLDVIAYFH